ncbi:MAG: methylthioribose-1-phosphate isomerase MtnA [Candidatus Bathyarchaeota archaeon B63]|nr:MAG: methylthioribose-1-phosphate isomerase MtnA [Candidatus Bathyarchaeota archaeon B63]
MRTIEWRSGVVVTIDQTALPLKEEWIELRRCEEVASAIREMRIRGAPLIGVAAAYGIALTAYHSKAETKEDLLRELERSAEVLRGTRPTAVNLFWAIDRLLERARAVSGGVEDLRRAIISEAERIADEDVETNRRIGLHGAPLLSDGDTVLTHCNAGSLATVDYGTALAVIRAAWEEGKRISVVADETRPKLQGARLTAYELMRDGIPVTLITDGMAGYVMSRGLVDKVIVGADRVVMDGVVNKIGTYSVAVLAREHGIPFYVAAPTSTFDLSKKSEDVIIEQRSPEEVTHVGPVRIAPEGVEVMNPAFDITPIEYIDAIICEKGVINRGDFQRFVQESV